MADCVFFEVPSVCPACSSHLSIEGDFLYCRSKSCVSRLFGDIKTWVNRLGLLFWGDSLITSLSNPDNRNSVSSVSDLYKMSVEDFENHCSGLKMAKKCWRSLNDNRTLPLEVVLYGLNIQNLGLSTATDIVNAGYDSVQKILSLSQEDLVLVPNIGKVLAAQIKDGLDSKCDLLVELGSILDIKKKESGPLTGKKVCITGDVWAPRKLVQKLIISLGGQAVDSVSKDTSLLICDDSSSSSSKMKKAVSYGIPVVDGSSFKKLIDGIVSWDELVTK
jgi:DNA ligase (NAD+)